MRGAPFGGAPLAAGRARPAGAVNLAEMEDRKKEIDRIYEELTTQRVSGRKLTEADVKALAEALSEAMKPPEPSEAERKAAEAEKKAAKKRARRARRRREFIGILLRLAVIYVLFFQILGVTIMPSGDMSPRIDNGDLVLFYRLDRDVRAQDVIVLQKNTEKIQQAAAGQDGDVPDIALQISRSAAEDTSLWGKTKAALRSAAQWLGIVRPDGMQLFVCRVVAAGGDIVEITEGGSLIVNGNAQVESNIFYPTTSYIGFTEYPLTLKDDECFVMADKRNGGADSRFFGAVSRDEILGSVITIVRRNNL